MASNCKCLQLESFAKIDLAATSSASILAAMPGSCHCDNWQATPEHPQGSKSMLSTVDMTLSGKCAMSVSVVLVSIPLESAQRSICASLQVHNTGVQAGLRVHWITQWIQRVNMTQSQDV